MMENDFLHPGGEIFDIPGSAIQAEMVSVEDTTTVFDSMFDCDIHYATVPGHEGKSYVPWGHDDQLPYKMIRLVGDDEVTAQNKLFNIETCYGAGIELIDRATGQPTTDEDIEEWMERQALPTFMLEQITDMKYFYLSVAVIILSNDGKRINKIRHKEACYCRFEKPNKRGRIEHVFFGDWRGGRPKEVEMIPLLDPHDTLADLKQRLGLIPLDSGSMGVCTKDRKFAILSRFPTAGNQFYPIPYYSAIWRGGSYDEKRLISVGKRAKLRNSTSIKYHVEVEKDYWVRICKEERITDPKKMVERVKKEKENIRDFVTGIENSGKVWISGFYVNPNGDEVRDIRINVIDQGKKEGGDWTEDIQSASNTICYADNVHPNLVGAVPGKAQTNNSGSDKRELFTMKQALETAFKDLLLLPMRVCCRFNQFKVRPVINMIQLTTLDQHKDAQKVTTKPQNDDNN